jgi:predicted RNase H-like nuclease (RuvC/YqgF family)
VLREQVAAAQDDAESGTTRCRDLSRRVEELEAENGSLADSVGGMSSKLWTVNNELETARAEVRELRAAAR